MSVTMRLRMTVTAIDALLQWVEDVATPRLLDVADRHRENLLDRNNEGQHPAHSIKKR